ncbi:hypothetical protein [Christiangramia sabulilitoris]|uniref:Uncharacterized protein n=1 Tax=Christiangramia sabulilitoris TaxID=2583991 RepID=A0A550I5X1_9FLAO|nr:hypothetical protein [Christiangramia sabulilitoris]TRO66351.1 hypothetical protein FGM01_00260 [Christiangramia sabulilitoris]
MRNLTLIFALFFIGWSVSASVISKPATFNYYNYNDSFIFVEGGVEFAIYPNGEFDFYFNPDFRRGNSVHISTPNVNISYNAGYNYEPYVQYDDYGAVIQIENVPIYYDYYGRIIQAGNIFLNYNNFGRLARVGNLHIHYNHAHRITHYSGFINHYNRHYVYRPWHDYYRRPHVNVSVVFGRPYRAFYEPRRISYNQYVTVYNNYYVKERRQRNFYRPSQRVKSYNYGRRTDSRRDIAHVRSRNEYNAPATRKGVARERSYSDRKNKVRTDSRRIEKRNTSDRNQRIYSDRTERSTNSKGRANRVDNSTRTKQTSNSDRYEKRRERKPSATVENRRSSRLEKASPRTGQRSVQSGSNTRVNKTAPAQRSRTVEKSSRNSERNSTVNRQKRRSDVHVNKRTSAGSTRNESVRSKKSTSRRSSARNMDNRL